MNQRLKLVLAICRWGGGSLMVFLVLSSLFGLNMGPALAMHNGDVPMRQHPSWKAVSSPNIRMSDNGLDSMAVLSANDVWTVGSYFNSTSQNQTLIEHWNGSVWSIISSPNVVASSNLLAGVAAVSTSDVWAVGYYFQNGSPLNQTLIEHWNGSSWNIISSPNVGTGSNVLSGVTVVSASDVWAVGYSVNTSTNTQQTLIEHWNGSSWIVVSSPNIGTRYRNVLTGVAALSASDIWALGNFHNNNTRSWQTLTLHWNGSGWNVVSSPNNGARDNLLAGVAVVSTGDVWAVGYYHDPTHISLYQTLTLHWNGNNWSIVPSPDFGSSHNLLKGVAAISTSDVWAVGYYVTTSGYALTLALHWNGSTWRVVSTPNVGTGENTFSGVGAVSANDVWAVGYYRNTSNQQTLIEHYS